MYVSRGATAEERLRHFGWTETSDGCWEFNGARSAGYGRLWLNGRMRTAHRTAYEAWVGPVSDKQVVMHSCDNPPCINPAHLRAGTQADNLADMTAKGRRGTTKKT